MKEFKPNVKAYNNYDDDVSEHLLECFDPLGGEFTSDVFIKDSQKELVEEFIRDAEEDELPEKVINALKTIKKDLDEGVNFIIILNY